MGGHSRQHLFPPLTRHVEDMPKALALSPLSAEMGRGSSTPVALR